MKINWQLTLAALAVSTAPFALANTEFAGKSTAIDAQGNEYVKGEFIVKYRQTAVMAQSASSVNPDLSLYAETSLTENIATIKTIESKSVSALRFHDDSDLESQLDEIRSLPQVEIVEPNYIYSVDVTPNDALFAQQWGMINIGDRDPSVIDADIDADDAWDVSTGSEEVIVGIIDTGVDYKHVDLAANMWVNPREIPGNGIDDDANGYIDDIHGASTYFGSGDPMDTSDHGTHVAGTIGAVGNNGIGVAGVAWNVKLAACSFLGPDGRGTTEGAINCIKYMLNLKKAGNNIRVLNNSWGGGAQSAVLESLIEEVYANDMLFVAASGNDGWDNDSFPHFPSNYPTGNIISVAATDAADELAYFSNYGVVSVDIAAPGRSIISTIPGNEYATFSGTSMATPHVSGAAALLLSIVGEATTDELRELLVTSGDPLDSLKKDTVYGRRLNLANAMAAADPTPSYRLLPSPSAMSVIQGDTANFDILVKSIYDWNGHVQVAASSDRALPLSLSTTSGAPGDRIALTATTAANTPYGDYELFLTGDSGEIKQETAMTLEVVPAIMETQFKDQAPNIIIPDLDYAGANDSITIDENFINYEAELSIDISHEWRGDLIIDLVSPQGTKMRLLNREGGSKDDVKETWQLPSVRRENIKGEWKLKVQDHSPYVEGVLNEWKLTFKGVYESEPSADFEASNAGKTVSFNDVSFDNNDGGAVVAWAWNFGDGTTSDLKNPTHTYEKSGDYEISLVVTDNSGLTSRVSTQTRTTIDPAFKVQWFKAQSPFGGYLVGSVLDWETFAENGTEILRNDASIYTAYWVNFAVDFYFANSADEVVSYKICASGDYLCSAEANARVGDIATELPYYQFNRMVNQTAQSLNVQ